MIWSVRKFHQYLLKPVCEHVFWMCLHVVCNVYTMLRTSSSTAFFQRCCQKLEFAVYVVFPQTWAFRWEVWTNGYRNRPVVKGLLKSSNWRFIKYQNMDRTANVLGQMMCLWADCFLLVINTREWALLLRGHILIRLPFRMTLSLALGISLSYIPQHPPNAIITIINGTWHKSLAHITLSHQWGVMALYWYNAGAFSVSVSGSQILRATLARQTQCVGVLEGTAHTRQSNPLSSAGVNEIPRLQFVSDFTNIIWTLIEKGVAVRGAEIHLPESLSASPWGEFSLRDVNYDLILYQIALCLWGGVYPKTRP